MTIHQVVIHTYLLKREWNWVRGLGKGLFLIFLTLVLSNEPCVYVLLHYLKIKMQIPVPSIKTKKNKSNA